MITFFRCASIQTTLGISLCGLNHQARDFICATLLHLVDQLEESGNFIKFHHLVNQHEDD